MKLAVLPPLNNFSKNVHEASSPAPAKPLPIPTRLSPFQEQFLVPSPVLPSASTIVPSPSHEEHRVTNTELEEKQEEQRVVAPETKTTTTTTTNTALPPKPTAIPERKQPALQPPFVGPTAADVPHSSTTDASRPSTPKIRLRYYVNPGDSEKSVFFPYPQGIGVKPRADPKANLFQPKKPTRMKFFLYWERNCIKRVFKAAGLIRSSSSVMQNKIQGNGDWHVAWSKHFPLDQYRTLKPYQRVNSFPGTGCIGRKDTLASILARFDRRFLNSEAYKFVPATFTLRGHYGEMEKFMKAARLRAGHSITGRRLTKFKKRKKTSMARRTKQTNKTSRRGSDDSSTDSNGSDDSGGSEDEPDPTEQEIIENLKRRAELDQNRLTTKSRLYASGRGQKHSNSSQAAVIGSDLWICKPSASACGRGIRLVKYNDVPRLPMTIKVKDRSAAASLNNTNTNTNTNNEGKGTRQRVWNVQEYIADPLCIEGKKFDLRVYVLVTSFDPLRVYVFREGLCRICTNEYDLDYDTLDDTYKHLTNFSINKNAEKFVVNQDADSDDVGHKWSLSALFDHLDAHGYDVARLWRDMKEVAVKTLIACESEIFTQLKSLSGKDKCCYEVFGFDMMLNESLFVYLIEVNIYPSMATGSPLDKRIKETMITDALHIKGVPIPNKEMKVHSWSTNGLNRTKTNRTVSQKKREVLKRRLRTGKLGKLSNKDLEVIKDSATEFARAAATNYDIAFPCASSIRRMGEFFICPRYNNTLLHMLIMQSEEEDSGEVKLGKKEFKSARKGRNI